ncbi:MAG: serine/threonine protein kinase [Coprothermobacterota bacterium]|nr:serine/threonine protein kinase [Coprothermobacterota bacterium]
MAELLRRGQKIQTTNLGVAIEVDQFLGAGTQGEVYRATMGKNAIALKWFFPEYIAQDRRLQERLLKAIQAGAPSNRFLWPMGLASLQGNPSFGYVMPLRRSNFKGIVDLLKKKINLSFRGLATAGFETSHSYFQLHSKGFCYRDINWGNIFLDPQSGEVCICDNDNVDVDGRPGPIAGTQSFMAPEIVRGEKLPSTQTDLHSLAVLLFLMFFIHHPLHGKLEQGIHCFNPAAMKKLYGTHPVFIFDPSNQTNRPVPGEQDNPIIFWGIYPAFLKNRFVEAFSKGLYDPNSRVGETVWRGDMIRLRDSIFYCSHCGQENFYDRETMIAQHKPIPCWNCKKEVTFPPRIRFGDVKKRNPKVVMLNYKTQLFPHHIDEKKMYDFSKPVAEVVQHPTEPNRWGLRNLSKEKWVLALADGTMKDVPPGKTAPFIKGIKIHFGKVEGEIQA